MDGSSTKLFVAKAILVTSAIVVAQASNAQMSQKRGEEYESLVNKIVTYQKLSFCGLTSIFEERANLPKLKPEFKEVRGRANRELKKAIEDYAAAKELPKNASAEDRSVALHDAYLTLVGAADRRLQRFEKSATMVKECREILLKAGM